VREPLQRRCRHRELAATAYLRAVTASGIRRLPEAHAHHRALPLASRLEADESAAPMGGAQELASRWAGRPS